MNSGARPTLRQRLGTLRVVSWPGIIVISLVTVVSSFFYIAGSSTDSLPGVTLVAPAMIVLNLGLILLAKYAIFRNGETQPQPVVAVLALFAVVGLNRAMVPWAMGELGWIPPVVQLDFRIFQSVIVAVVWLTIANLAMDALVRQQQAIARLDREQQQLAVLRESAMAHLKSTRDEVDQMVNDELAPVIDRSIDQLSGLRDEPLTPGRLRETAGQLRQAAQQVVQPLSRQLTRKPPAAPEIEAPSEERRARLRLGEVLRSLSSTAPFNPGLTPPLVAVSQLGVAIQPYGLGTGLLGLLVGVCANFALLSLAKAGYERFHRRIPTRVWTVLWLVLLLLIAVVVALLQVYIWSDLSDSDGLTRALGAMVITQVGCGMLLALNRAASDQLERDGRAISSTVRAYQVEVSGLMQAQQAIGREIGIAIHGPIQSAFVANSLRLEMAASTLENDGYSGVVTDEIDQAYTDLLDTKEQLDLLLDHSRRSVQMDEGLEAIATAWRGLVEVTYRIDPPDLGTSIGQLGAVVIDIVREAIINAAKHGGAKQVTVTLTASETSVDIEVDDDGTGPSAHFDAGVGLGDLAGSSAQYSLHRGDLAGASLRVRIPRGSATGTTRL